MRLKHPKLPADARVLYVREDWARRALMAVVESAEFEEVPDGGEIPLFDPDGPITEYVLRYIDGDRLTDVPHVNRREVVAAEDIKAGQLADLQGNATPESYIDCNKHAMTTTVDLSAPSPLGTSREELHESLRRFKSMPVEPINPTTGERIQLPGAPNVPVTHHGNVVGHAEVKDGRANIVIAKTTATDALDKETSREFFERVMSQTD